MTGFDLEPSTNVFGEPLEPCSNDPMTGFFRDGSCNTCTEDHGSHTVCVEVTEAFLQYSRFAGNDLSTPHPEAGFAGLRPGDRWCLCASRWLQAQSKGMAPRCVSAQYPPPGTGHRAHLDLLKAHAVTP